jgi:LmbE family N-acetylglucosaminyl deacetylase
MHEILIIAPHGLDEVLGCGGSVARFVTEGARAHLLVLNGNGTGRDKERRAATRKVGEKLGFSSVEFGGIPENQSDTVPLSDLIGAVEKVVRAHAPSTVYVSHGGNLNIDHQNAFRAAVTAVRPVPGSSVRAVYAYEVQSSTDWAPAGAGAAFAPTEFVDITEYLDLKFECLALYGDEMRPPPHARSIESAGALAQRRGATVGCGAAEAFQLLRRIV